MSDQIPDYETVIRTEIFAEGRVMTYLLLSRKLGIHVNQAKRYLYEFQQKTSEKLHTTYIVSGYEKINVSGPVTNSNSIQNKFQLVSIRESYRPQTQEESSERLERVICKVPEEKLKEKINNLEKVTAVHIYSIGSAISNDITLLTEAFQQVKQIDCDLETNVGQLSSKYGVIVNPLIDKNLIVVPKKIDAPTKVGSAYKYQPAARVETVPVKQEKRTIKVEKKASKESSESHVTGAAKAAKALSTLNNSSNKDSRKQPTLSQTFFGKKPVKAPVKQKTIVDAILEKAAKNSKFTETFSVDENDIDESNKEEAVKNEKETKKEIKNEKLEQVKEKQPKEKQKSVEISEELKNMFADVENNRSVTPEIQSEDENMTEKSDSDKDEDGDVEMNDVPQPVPERKEASPPPPPAAKGRKMKKVLKRTTKLDQLGYLVTHTEEVWESCSESEEETKPVVKPKPRSIPPIAPPGTKSKKKNPDPTSLLDLSLRNSFRFNPIYSDIIEKSEHKMRVKLTKEQRLSAAAAAFAQPDEIRRPPFNSSNDSNSIPYSESVHEPEEGINNSETLIPVISFRARKHRFSCLSCCSGDKASPSASCNETSQMIETSTNSCNTSEKRTIHVESRASTTASSVKGSSCFTSSTGSTPRSILKSSHHKNSLQISCQDLDQKLVDVSETSITVDRHPTFSISSSKKQLNPNILQPISPIPVQPPNSKLVAKIRDVTNNCSNVKIPSSLAIVMQAESAPIKTPTTALEANKLACSAPIMFTPLQSDSNTENSHSQNVSINSFNNEIGSMACIFKEDVSQIGELDDSPRVIPLGTMGSLIDLNNDESVHDIWR